ncbi:hypothetical protein NC651_032088 [Populus alba x Populus x berolinensis]|nr:hypothetical protein NC651_032088 [Populus alba x Populus x berolinensis]
MKDWHDGINCLCTQLVVVLESKLHLISPHRFESYGGDEASLRATAHLLYYIREHDARMWGRCSGVIPLREKIRDLLTVKCWQDSQ